MSLKPRKRISSNEDVKRTIEYVKRPKLHKISLYIEEADVRIMKKKAVDEGITLTDIFQKLARDYIQGG